MSADNYQHSNVTGESWTRAKRIVIENPLGETPVAKFVEEKVVNVDQGEKFFKDQGVLEVKTDTETMDEKIPIVDLTTGVDTGATITYGELHALLKSAYIHYAKKRDTPPTVIQEEPTSPDSTTSSSEEV